MDLEFDMVTNAHSGTAFQVAADCIWPFNSKEGQRFRKERLTRLKEEELNRVSQPMETGTRAEVLMDLKPDLLLITFIKKPEDGPSDGIELIQTNGRFYISGISPGSAAAQHNAIQELITMNGYHVVGAEHLGRTEEDVRVTLPLDLANRTFKAGDILLGMGCVLFERFNDEHLHKLSQNKEHDVIFFYGDLLQRQPDEELKFASWRQRSYRTSALILRINEDGFTATSGLEVPSTTVLQDLANVCMLPLMEGGHIDFKLPTEQFWWSALTAEDHKWEQVQDRVMVPKEWEPPIGHQADITEEYAQAHWHHMEPDEPEPFTVITPEHLEGLSEIQIRICHILARDSFFLTENECPEHVP